MAQNVTPLSGYVWSSAELRKGAGQRGPFFNYIDKRLSIADRAFRFDDFDNKTIDTTLWAVTTGAAATIAAIFVPGGTTMAGVGHGFARMAGTSGASPTGCSSLYGPLEFFGTQNAGVEIRFRQASGDTVLSAQFEFGFVDAGGVTAAVSDIDTPAATATVCALFAIDPTQTLTSAGFVTKGGASGTGTGSMSAKVTPLRFVPGMLPTSSGTTTATGIYLNPGTFCTVRIELRNNTAFCFVNGQSVAQHNSLTNEATGNPNRGGYVMPTRALAPWVFVKDVLGGISNIDIDYIVAWQDRVGG